MKFWFTAVLGIVLVLLGSWLVSYQTAKAPAYETATFGGVSLRLEYATTSEQVTRGLGGRAEVLADYGMLFVFPSAGKQGFWMKDMQVPIDIFWLDDKRQVVSMFTDISPDTYPTVFYPSDLASYVLETRAGFAREHSVATGTTLILKN